ncbi:MAG: hypothetical protein KKA67_14875 [Spirochaetes bacterium]|nr:hypothetical protein [Spirochaetota bacterium]MBU1081914.1 hypothetical protein [Spirochaetota bacterium]
MVDRFRHFKLGLGSRLVIAGILYALAVVLQVALGSRLLGLPAVIAAWYFLSLSPATNKPKDKGLEEWRAVTDGEIARVADNLARSQKLRASLAGPAVLKGFALALALAASLFSSYGSPRLSLALFDLAMFAVPGLFFGRVVAHVPYEFNMKLSRFLSAMGVPRPDGFVLTPYLRFDEDEQGRDVPEDLRLMLEPRRKPEDLVGVQFQASINKGANGNVPYMYAVVLTKGRGGPAYERFKTMRARGFEVEPGGDADYGTVVVRQATDNGGYHTDDEDCERLMGLMVKALQKA